MRRWWLAACVAGTMWPAASYGATPEECKALRHHGKLAEAKSCFTLLVDSHDPFNQAEGFLGLGRYSEANERFREAVKEQPKSASIRVEWGRLFLAHYQGGDAAKLFEEALELDKNYAPAYLGLARVAAEGFDRRAVDFANKAVEHDGKLIEAHELLAYLALEDSNRNLATEEAQKALTLSSEALDAMAVLASMDWLDGKAETPWIGRLLKVNPSYGEAYDTGAHFFEFNRRYKEAIAIDRKALELNASLWAARSHLGINLMRLGQTAEARQELKRCYDAQGSSPQTRNALKFLDTVNNYETFKSASTELVLNRKEAALLRPYIEPEMRRAMATYERKYKMTLPGPVRLEVYPNHEDFVVRTLGLPGQGGLLGVAFGLVVAMDSPSSRPPGEFNWASTMWHEMSHVYVLTATNHLVPRWFTEGLAVHEEGAASPDWGDRMTPAIVQALKDKKLLPVLELDRGFVRPDYPGQVIVSYFEAGKICDYIVSKWGDNAVLGIIHSYAARKTTAEAIQDNLHESPADFDKGFAGWLDHQAGNTAAHYDEWKAGVKSAYAQLHEGKSDDALRKGLAIRNLYSDYVGANSDYELLAEIYAGQNKKPQAAEQLEHYRDLGGTNIQTLKKLAKLEQDLGNDAEAQKTWKDLTYIYPEDEEEHRRYGGLLLASGEASGAIREYNAVLDLKPADTAESHYNLAQALCAAHRTNEAKDEVLASLEAAPGFKPAQQLLLKLSQ